MQNYKKHAKKHLKQGIKALIYSSEKAIFEFKKAIKLNPNLAEAYYWLSLYCDTTEQMKVLNKAIETKPDYTEAYEIRGLLYENFYENPKSALADYNIAISLNPKNAETYKSRADILKQFERYDEAIADYKKAISLETENSSYLTSLGLCYLAKNNLKSATKCFKKAIRKTKDNFCKARAYQYLGYTYIANNEEISNAIKYLKKSIEFFEKTPFPQEAPYEDLKIILSEEKAKQEK